MASPPPVPAPGDIVALYLDGAQVFSVPFSEFVVVKKNDTELPHVYMLKTRYLWVKIDFVNGRLTVDADNTMDGPKALPQTVELIAPDHSGRFLYRDLSPRIKFRWKPAPHATKYHFVIARDPQFQDILLDERLAQPEFMHGKLPHSVYYWRVSALNHWQEGLFSDAWQFTTVQKRSAPDLVVNFPPKRVNEKRCMITGSVEPGARVFIMGRRVTIDGEGNFKHTIELARRINLLVVEAIDAAGNVSYRSRLVHGAF